MVHWHYKHHTCQPSYRWCISFITILIKMKLWFYLKTACLSTKVCTTCQSLPWRWTIWEVCAPQKIGKSKKWGDKKRWGNSRRVNRKCWSDSDNGLVILWEYRITYGLKQCAIGYHWGRPPDEDPRDHVQKMWKTLWKKENWVRMSTRQRQMKTDWEWEDGNQLYSACR